MQSATTLFGVSFRQALRFGQRRALEHPRLLNGPTLVVKNPTGYGKTYLAAGAYSIRQRNQLSNRMLYLSPSRGLRNQFMSAFPRYMALADVQGPRLITDIGFTPENECILRHRRNECQIFTTTIQYLYQGGLRCVQRLMEQGLWMIPVDEYHHYGMEKAWGQRLMTLPSNFLLALSATPNRPDDDGPFGPPHVNVTYREGVQEGVLKPLVGHSYDYKIDLIDKDGVLRTYVTSELIAEVGSDNPDAIEQFRIKKKMRWSPKYVSPLIATPVQRMQAQRIRTGERRLQFLATAMCVSHAELVCTQLQSNFPELRIDWVGTGEFGRTDEENKALLDRFCPPDGSDPILDGLVHVGMVAEGIDTIFVSEIMQLCPANYNNRTIQIAGRASRPVRDNSAPNRSITAHINFDGSTELARGLTINGNTIRAVGSAMIDAMDIQPPTKPDEDDEIVEGEPDDDDDIFPPELPDEPLIQITNLELIGIDSGDEGVQQMARVMEAVSNPLDDFIDFSSLKNDPNALDWNKVLDAYRKMRAAEARQYDEKAIVAQWKDSVEGAVSTIAGIVIGIMRGINNPAFRIDRTLPGDLRRRVNERKKSILGPIQAIPETYKLHYTWLRNLERELRRTKKIPEWLL